MGSVLIIIGALLLAYSALAALLGLPQLSDFLPVGMFDAKSEGRFYKIIETEGPDKGFILMNVCSVGLVLIGLLINYFFK